MINYLPKDLIVHKRFPAFSWSQNLRIMCYVYHKARNYKYGDGYIVEQEENPVTWAYRFEEY